MRTEKRVYYTEEEFAQKFPTAVFKEGGIEISVKRETRWWDHAPKGEVLDAGHWHLLIAGFQKQLYHPESTEELLKSIDDTVAALMKAKVFIVASQVTE